MGILSLGWSYVLSACLVERQGRDGATMSYTDSMATGHQSGTADASPALSVAIGNVDEDIARWWAAILAPDQGWTAIVSRQDSETYHAPWSVSPEGTPCFKVRWREGEAPVPNATRIKPPSSSEALEFLAQFSALHDLGEQLVAALAAALLFPTHNYYGITVKLSYPAPAGGRTRDASVREVEPEWVGLSKELPYYMTLSCSPGAVMSSLCGTFWDADVPCNLVSPWLHPVIHEIPMGRGVAHAPGRYHEILAFVGARCCPRLAALWLGAAASGLAPKILTLVESGTPPLNDNAFPWTGCEQSFMDTPGSGSYFAPGSSKARIERADVWRLRFLPSVVDDDLYYERRPFALWMPAGRMRGQDCDLRVRAHQDCRRHSLAYRHWNWKLEDGSTVID